MLGMEGARQWAQETIAYKTSKVVASLALILEII